MARYKNARLGICFKNIRWTDEIKWIKRISNLIQLPRLKPVLQPSQRFFRDHLLTFRFYENLFFHLCNDVETQKHTRTHTHTKTSMRYEPEVKNCWTVRPPDACNAFILFARLNGRSLVLVQYSSLQKVLIVPCTSGVSYRFDRSHEGQWMNLCYGLRVPLLTEVLLKLVEVLWVCFIQNMHKLALIIVVVIMRETVEK